MLKRVWPLWFAIAFALGCATAPPVQVAAWDQPPHAMSQDGFDRSIFQKGIDRCLGKALSLSQSSSADLATISLNGTFHINDQGQVTALHFGVQNNVPHAARKCLDSFFAKGPFARGVLGSDVPVLFTATLDPSARYYRHDIFFDPPSKDLPYPAGALWRIQSMQMLQARSDILLSCVITAGKPKQRVLGRDTIEVDLQIGPGGSITSVEIVNPRLPEPLKDCLENQIQSWPMAKTPDGQEHAQRYRIELAFSLR